MNEIARTSSTGRLTGVGKGPALPTDVEAVGAWMEDFGEFYAASFQRVFRSLVAATGNRSAAEDATQEAFSRALQRWTTLGKEEWAAGWVLVTALNIVRRDLRRRPLIAKSTESESDHTTRMAVWTAVGALPRRQREAAVLYYFCDMSIAESAAIMGCSQGTVKSHLMKARQALAKRMRDGD